MSGTAIPGAVTRPGCPAPCDPGCEASCHQSHVPVHGRWHDPGWSCGEVQRAIAEAVAAERDRIAAGLDALAANYPEDVFPPSSDSRDGISGTAMRHAYRNAARAARQPRGDDPPSSLADGPGSPEIEGQMELAEGK